MTNIEDLFEFNSVLYGGDISRLEALKRKEAEGNEQSKNVTGRINLETMIYKYEKELEITFKVSNGYNHFLMLKADFDNNRYSINEILAAPMLKSEIDFIKKAEKDGRIIHENPDNSEEMYAAIKQNLNEFKEFDTARKCFVDLIVKVKKEEKDRVYFERVSNLSFIR